MESKGLLRSELLPSGSPRCSITEGDGKACCAESSRAKSTRSGEVRSPSGTAAGKSPKEPEAAGLKENGRTPQFH